MSSDSRLYKGRYFIIFYDKTGEMPLHIFDNVKDILKFQKKPLTKENINYINVRLYRALRTKEHFVTFLTGKVMRVYIFDENSEED